MVRLKQTDWPIRANDQQSPPWHMQRTSGIRRIKAEGAPENNGSTAGKDGALWGDKHWSVRVGKERRDSRCRSGPSAGHSCHAPHCVWILFLKQTCPLSILNITYSPILFRNRGDAVEQDPLSVYTAQDTSTHTHVENQPTVRGWGQVCSSSSMMPKDSWDAALIPPLCDSAALARRCLSTHLSLSPSSDPPAPLLLYLPDLPSPPPHPLWSPAAEKMRETKRYHSVANFWREKKPMVYKYSQIITIWFCFDCCITLNQPAEVLIKRAADITVTHV